MKEHKKSFAVRSTIKSFTSHPLTDYSNDNCAAIDHMKCLLPFITLFKHLNTGLNMYPFAFKRFMDYKPNFFGIAFHLKRGGTRLALPRNLPHELRYMVKPQTYERSYVLNHYLRTMVFKASY